jgi:hypothetical protein
VCYFTLFFLSNAKNYMKKFLMATALSGILLGTISLQAQDDDKSKRPSPPAMVRMTTTSGARIQIDYSQPSLKGRTMGKDVEPMKGQVWRAGANEATVFEVNKNVTVEGKALPAGKYALFMIANGADWTIIFNKTAAQWGAYDYKQSADALRVNVKATTRTPSVERLTYTISKDGKVSLLWGTTDVSFNVK